MGLGFKKFRSLGGVRPLYGRTGWEFQIRSWSEVIAQLQNCEVGTKRLRTGSVPQAATKKSTGVLYDETLKVPQGPKSLHPKTYTMRVPKSSQLVEYLCEPVV